MHLRRKLLLAAALGAVLPRRTLAQPKVARIGYLRQSRSAMMQLRFEAFRQALRDLGWIEGKSIAIEERSAGGDAAELAALATELVALKVQVIVADGGTPTIMAAKRATETIPIVFPTVGDPVAQGLVKSYSRPGGNLTGLSLQGPDAAGKRLEIVKQLLPAARRVGFLTNPTNPASIPILRELQAAADKAGVQLELMEAKSPAEIDAAFAAIAKKPVDAVVIFADQMLNDQSSRISILAAKLRVPSIGENSVNAERGALASYGPDRLDMLRRAASYVDRILKGAKPGDLPIEQPTKFELVINSATAKAIGVTVPQAVLLRADRVIE